MAVKLDYTITKNAYGARFEYQNDLSLTKGAREVITSFLSWILLCSLALYTSVLAEKPLFTFLFIILLALNSARLIPLLKFRSRSISNSVKNLKEKDVVLYLNEEGLTEETNGIISKVPWTSVISYVLFKGNLFVELAGDLCAIVPSGPLKEGSNTIEEAVQYLKTNNVQTGNKNVA